MATSAAPAQLATQRQAKGWAPWAPATVPGQQVSQQRQQGHQVSSEAARPAI